MYYWRLCSIGLIESVACVLHIVDAEFAKGEFRVLSDKPILVIWQVLDNFSRQDGPPTVKVHSYPGNEQTRTVIIGKMHNEVEYAQFLSLFTYFFT
jgi:hypothetical protein